MADNFKRPKKPQYEAGDQNPVDTNRTEDTPLSTEFQDSEPTQSRAKILIDEYGKTIEFHKFIEKLLREISQVEVEINPEDDPEVWIAMKRTFGDTASPKMNQESYFQVIDALEAIERIEQLESDPRNGAETNDLFESLPDSQEVEESEILDEEFQISAIDEIEAKARVKRSSAFRDPPPPPPPPAPPEEKPWLRRWRKYLRKVNVLGKPYRVQWLRNRWWRK